MVPFAVASDPSDTSLSTHHLQLNDIAGFEEHLSKEVKQLWQLPVFGFISLSTSQLLLKF